MQAGLRLPEFDEHIDRCDGDLPHPVPLPGSVSREPYAEPGCGLP